MPFHSKDDYLNAGITTVSGWAASFNQAEADEAAPWLAWYNGVDDYADDLKTKVGSGFASNPPGPPPPPPHI